MRIKHEWTERSATIGIEGLARTVRVLHVTDQHIGLIDDRDATTLEFVRLVTRAENLAAVLCGHIHFPHADSLGPHAVQYVGAPGYEGGYRIVELRPLPGA